MRGKIMHETDFGYTDHTNEIRKIHRRLEIIEELLAGKQEETACPDCGSGEINYYFFYERAGTSRQCAFYCANCKRKGDEFGELWQARKSFFDGGRK
jgi:DNA-directed RNA polymerase subunit M/transcription elongation factor TFIIS